MPEVDMITKLLRPFLKLFGRKVYCQDGLITVHNHDFLLDPDFQSAYERGLKADGHDYSFHWRVHVALWAAHQASRVAGDFVECGVNRGFVSSAILASLSWNRLEKSFYLLDTFNGPDISLLSKEETEAGYIRRKEAGAASGFYTTAVEGVIANFKEWERIVIIKGSIPATLSQVTASAICFLHIDLNCSEPEVSALRHFWDKLSPGALVLLDDYAYVGFEISKRAMDAFAREKGIRILSLPTGQGIIVKPMV